MYSKLVVQVFLALTVSTAVFAASVARKDDEDIKELNILKKVYDDCESKEDFTGCLKGKALTAISRAVEQVKI
jgi:hypothetical protein